MSQLQVTGEAKIRDIQGPVVANSGVITALDGAASQYVRGDGTLADFPTSTGGGSSVSYYLNGSVNQGTFGGSTYYEMSKTPIIGAGTDFPVSTNGLVAQFITDANDPDLLEVPGGNFNVEFYFSVNNNTGNPTVYAELYKYNGTTFTLLGSSQAIPESINQGTTIAPYYFAIPVGTAALNNTDRIAIRIFANVDGRTVTLHTENSHLCQVVTTFSKGMVSLNNLTKQNQYLTTGTSGTNFNIVSSDDTHTFNLPVASATNTGKLSSTDWSTFNAKQPAGNYVTLDTTQTITAAKTISGLLTVNNKIYLQTDLSTTGVYLQSYNSNEFSIGVTSGATTYYSDFNLQGANRNYTFPNIDGTIALLEGTQTFSGAKTFSLDILVNGLTIGRGAGSISTNTVVGSSALAANTTGYGNTSIGLNNLIANTTGFFNVAIGASSLISNTTGTYNAALGTSSLYNNTTGSNNTAVGQQAGESNTTGSNNTYIGWGSGYGIQTGSNNTIIGAYTGTAALANNIVLADGAGNVRYQWNGTNNVFGNPISGTSASFSSNVNVGTNIAQLLPITTTNFQILTGCYYDGSNIIATATSGTRIISNAGSFTFNNFTGATIGGSVTDTTRLTLASTGAATFSSSVSARSGLTGTITAITTNDASGFGVGLGYVSGSYGYVTSQSASSPLVLAIDGGERMRITTSGNVGIGTSSPSALLHTYSSTNGAEVARFEGAYAGSGTVVLARFSRNGNAVSNVIRYSDTAGLIQYGSTTGHDTAFITNDTERMRITSGGEVLMNTSSVLTSGWLCIAVPSNNYNAIVLKDTGTSYSSGNYYQLFTNSTNTICGSIAHITASTVLYNTSSDYRLKEDLKDFNGLDILSNIKFYDFKWKNEDIRMHGVIAHELQEIVPLSVSGIKDELNDEGNIAAQGVDYSKLVPILGKAIQELKAEIEELKALINK